jgi:hypothetical protein
VGKDDKTITITLSTLRALIAEGIAAERSSPKSIDEMAADHLRRARGQDRPLPESDSVPCVSPITKATFRARRQVDSSGRLTVVELLEYTRPKGWDALKKDGGLATESMLMLGEHGYTKKAQWEQHKAYYLRDWSEIGGTADGRRELPDHWIDKTKLAEEAAAQDAKPEVETDAAE